MAAPGATKKVAAGSLAGHITIVVLWVLRTQGGLEIPGEVGAAILGIVGFGTAYMLRTE